MNGVNETNKSNQLIANETDKANKSNAADGIEMAKQGTTGISGVQIHGYGKWDFLHRSVFVSDRCERVVADRTEL